MTAVCAATKRNALPAAVPTVTYQISTNHKTHAIVFISGWVGRTASFSFSSFSCGGLAKNTHDLFVGAFGSNSSACRQRRLLYGATVWSPTHGRNSRRVIGVPAGAEVAVHVRDDVSARIPVVHGGDLCKRPPTVLDLQVGGWASRASKSRQHDVQTARKSAS